jgi:hypothetical protein
MSGYGTRSPGQEAVMVTLPAYAALQHFLIDLDLYQCIPCKGALDEPLLFLLCDA